MPTSSSRIRQARLFAKLTQGELAEKVGVQRGAVAQWEQATGTHPSAANLCQIAVATHVGFEWLATGRGAMRVADSRQASALVMSEFAHNDLESRLLIAIRRMRSTRKRRVIVEMIEGLIG